MYLFSSVQTARFVFGPQLWVSWPPSATRDFKLLARVHDRSLASNPGSHCHSSNPGHLCIASRLSLRMRVCPACHVARQLWPRSHTCTTCAPRAFYQGLFPGHDGDFNCKGCLCGLRLKSIFARSNENAPLQRSGCCYYTQDWLVCENPTRNGSVTVVRS